MNSIFHALIFRKDFRKPFNGNSEFVIIFLFLLLGTLLLILVSSSSRFYSLFPYFFFFRFSLFSFSCLSFWGMGIPLRTLCPWEWKLMETLSMLICKAFSLWLFLCKNEWIIYENQRFSSSSVKIFGNVPRTTFFLMGLTAL